MTPVAARWALLRTSARSMPVVSESPPAPGLSWVSAITIGLRAVLASSIACSTPSSGRVDAAVEIILVADNDVRDGIGRGIGIGLGHAIGEHARPAIGEIGGRKARRKGQRRHRFVLQRRQLVVDAFGRLVVGALPADRNQERQLPERLCEFAASCSAAARDDRRRRGRCRPCRHGDRCDRQSAHRHARPFPASHWRAGRG